MVASQTDTTTHQVSARMPDSISIQYNGNLIGLASSQTEPGYCKVVFGKPLQAALKPSINKQKAKKDKQHGKKTTASPAELLQPFFIPEGEDPVAIANFKSAIEASFQAHAAKETEEQQAVQASAGGKCPDTAAKVDQAAEHEQLKKLVSSVQQQMRLVMLQNSDMSGRISRLEADGKECKKERW